MISNDNGCSTIQYYNSMDKITSSQIKFRLTKLHQELFIKLFLHWSLQRYITHLENKARMKNNLLY
jgi:hypothetical protein